ncbi:MAG: hypothetical protein CM15mV90_120 [uncultured marine virus]|nr:MAG: hypothetical protein CM15mV90_120 [uncultured marine virus]
MTITKQQLKAKIEALELKNAKTTEFKRKHKKQRLSLCL